MALLEARGLVKQYGKRTVVNGVDLDVNAGEIVGLLGPNGAGKTTTFRMVVGMIAPKAGRVSFAGHDVTNMAMYQRARLGLGYLAQDSSVFRKLTVEQNLYAILELMTTRRGTPFRSTSAQRRQRVDELLERFRIGHLRKSIAMTLSGGERRRLEIARCLVSEPMLIMLDEPFTGIDPRTVGDIQEIVRSLKDSGIGVLITDHHVRETLKITDRSYLIADGRTLTHGSAQEIVNNRQARELYLGHSFDDGGLLSESPSPTAASGGAAEPRLSDPETIKRLVQGLTEPDWMSAGAALRALGELAIPELLLGMRAAVPDHRARAHAVLCEILAARVVFDPQGTEATRNRQLDAIITALARRKAG